MVVTKNFQWRSLTTYHRFPQVLFYIDNHSRKMWAPWHKVWIAQWCWSDVIMHSHTTNMYLLSVLNYKYQSTSLHDCWTYICTHNIIKSVLPLMGYIIFCSVDVIAKHILPVVRSQCALITENPRAHCHSCTSLYNNTLCYFEQLLMSPLRILVLNGHLQARIAVIINSYVYLYTSPALSYWVT